MGVYKALNAFDQAVKNTRQAHQTKLEDSYVKLLTDLENAEFDYANGAIASKEADFNTAVEKVNEGWALIRGTLTDELNKAIDHAQEHINTAAETKRSALALRAAEIKYAISSIYDYDAQHTLSKALD